MQLTFPPRGASEGVLCTGVGCALSFDADVFSAGVEGEDFALGAGDLAGVDENGASGRRYMCQRLRTAFSDRRPPSCLALVAHMHAPCRCTSLRSIASSALLQPDAMLLTTPDEAAAVAVWESLRALELALLAVASAGFRTRSSLRVLRPGFPGGGKPPSLAASFIRNCASAPAILSELPAYLDTTTLFTLQFCLMEPGDEELQ